MASSEVEEIPTRFASPKALEEVGRISMRISELANRVPVKTIQIGEGILGTNQTVDQMKKVILASLGNQVVRMTAERLVTNIEPNDREGEAEVVYGFVRDKVRYTKDPKGLEYVQTPEYLLLAIERNGIAFGDCDDKTTLGLALLKNLGYNVAVRVASYREPGVYSHVYGLVKINREWVPFDATPDNKWLGWEMPAKDIKDYPITPYGWDLGEITMSNIDVGQIAQLAIAIAVGGVLTACVMKKL